jgi:acetolactate synthase-1/2/3 large subunit
MTKTHDAVVQTIVDAGATTCFTLPGLAITWSLGAFYERRKELRVVLARSEQIASIMAQVAGRLTRRPSVFMGQGPFVATTGAFGILEAHFSGSPMVVLTETSDYDGFGQYGVYQTMTGDYGAGDIMGALRGITKYCTYATEPQEAIYGLQLAFKHASLPRYGPAAVVMKSGIVREELPPSPRARLYSTVGHLVHTPARPDDRAVERLADLINRAARPIVVAGNGVVMAAAGAALERLADRAGIAVASSYHAKGVVDETAAYAVGMLGNWGAAAANRALAEADLVLMLGASMGPDYTRFRDPALIRPGEQTLVQVDVEPRNAGWVYPVDLAVTGDVADVLHRLEDLAIDTHRRRARLEAIQRIKGETGYDGAVATQPAKTGSDFATIVRAFQDFLTADDLLTLDAGSNRIWMTHALRVRHPGQLLVPGGIGRMGWGAPAAAAAKLCMPRKRVTCLIGDGGFAMTMAVLATCVQENLPVVIVVANNRGLGMVRDNLGDQRIAADFSDIDFAKVAEGMGCLGIRLDAGKGLRDALHEAHRSGRPAVIDVLVDPEASHHPASNN